MISASPLPTRSPRSFEVPTLILWAVIHVGWAGLTFFHDRVPGLMLALAGGWLVAWHSAFQHEAIHGHPTSSPRLNTALASIPLSLWLPFPAYRRSHVAHHATHDLTAPGQDPEARYFDSAALESPLRRALSRTASTLLGRLLLGPMIEVGSFLVDEARLVLADRQDRRAIWSVHLLLVGALTAWLVLVCGMSLGQYLLCFVYPGVALTLLRSFAEHRAHADPAQRIAIVENAPVLGLLFLNNNLHAAHHERPGLAWYDLPAFHARERARLVAGNGGLVYDGYGEVCRRYLLSAHDHLDHALALERSR